MVGFVVIFLLIGTSTVLGISSSCLDVQKLLWKGKMTWENSPLIAEDFENHVDFVLALEVMKWEDGKSDASLFAQHQFFVMQSSNDKPVPSVQDTSVQNPSTGTSRIIKSRSYRFNTLNIFPLHDQGGAVLQANFINLESKLSIIVPILPDGMQNNRRSIVNSDLNEALLKLGDLSTGDFYRYSAEWLRPLMKRAVRMDPPTSVGGPVEKWGNMFLTECQYVSEDVLQRFLSLSQEEEEGEAEESMTEKDDEKSCGTEDEVYGVDYEEDYDGHEVEDEYYESEVQDDADLDYSYEDDDYDW